MQAKRIKKCVCECVFVRETFFVSFYVYVCFGLCLLIFLWFEFWLVGLNSNAHTTTFTGFSRQMVMLTFNRKINVRLNAGIYVSPR